MASKIWNYAILLTTVLTLLGCRPPAQTGGGGKSPAEQRIGQPEGQAYDFWFDGKVSPPSLARADLRACGQIGKFNARNVQGVEAGDLRKVLTGTWVREFTWYGTAVPTDSALYFEFTSDSEFVAMEIDRVGLGPGAFTRHLDELRNSLERRSQTPTITFLDCDAMIVDRYYRISQELVFDGLQVTAEPTRGAALQSAWEQIRTQGLLDRREQLILPKRLSRVPGSETLAPSIVGARWTGRLAEQAVRGVKGVSLKMSGEYSGSHWKQAAAVKGVEDAAFFREGGFYVAAKDLQAPWKKEILSTEERIQIEWERVVVDPALGI